MTVPPNAASAASTSESAFRLWITAGLPRPAGGEPLEPAERLGARLGTACLVRMDPQSCEHARVAPGDVECGAARLDPRPNRDHTFDARLAGPRQQLLRRRLAPVEVRVGVDHATAVSSSTRGKSGSAGTIPSTAVVRP